MKKIFLLTVVFAFPAFAQTPTPTIVYGAASAASGNQDSYVVVQPENAPNPLGNPIVTTPQSPAEQPLSATKSAPESARSNINTVNQTAPQNPEPFSESPKDENSQIQNTLYQGGNRIYDVQSFPVNDIKTITEPNIQPTISTYPEY